MFGSPFQRLNDSADLFQTLRLDPDFEGSFKNSFGVLTVKYEEQKYPLANCFR